MPPPPVQRMDVPFSERPRNRGSLYRNPSSLRLHQQRLRKLSVHIRGKQAPFRLVDVYICFFAMRSAFGQQCIRFSYPLNTARRVDYACALFAAVCVAFQHHTYKPFRGLGPREEVANEIRMRHGGDYCFSRICDAWARAAATTKIPRQKRKIHIIFGH